MHCTGTREYQKCAVLGTREHGLETTKSQRHCWDSTVPLLGQNCASVATNGVASGRWNYGTDSLFYASFLHFQCTSTHQRKRQRSKCVYWYFFTNNIPTIFKWQASRESILKENFRKHSYQPMNQLNQIN